MLVGHARRAQTRDPQRHDRARLREVPMVRQTVFVLVACSLLAACAGDAPPPATPSDQVVAEPAPVPVLDDHMKALEDAKAVQATLDKAAAERGKALDDAGG